MSNNVNNASTQIHTPTKGEGFGCRAAFPTDSGGGIPGGVPTGAQAEGGPLQKIDIVLNIAGGTHIVNPA
jgi:hypothetical protein